MPTTISKIGYILKDKHILPDKILRYFPGKSGKIISKIISKIICKDYHWYFVCVFPFFRKYIKKYCKSIAVVCIQNLLDFTLVLETAR